MNQATLECGEHMRLINYRRHRKRQTGFLLGELVFEVYAVMQALGIDRNIKGAKHPESIDEWLLAGDDAWLLLRESYQAFLEADSNNLLEPAGEIGQLTIEPVVCDPGKIICVAMNYPHHDGSMTKPNYPVLFLKPKSTLNGHQQPVLLPSGEHTIEYEGEIAVVIGRKGKHISGDKTFSHIAGYCLANDIGAQDLQKRSSQWASGKIQETFTPLGPSLVTEDEFENVNNICLRTVLNGVIVQDQDSLEMFYSISELIAYISTLTTLEVGDLILTGSPRKTGSYPDPRTPLKSGDRVDIMASGLGTLSSPIIQEEMVQ
jgi:2-keto-4-pentenoate hydratase/2-oxohepta-3-ene-1,7-dioic acid hydratase in catechol pathway